MTNILALAALLLVPARPAAAAPIVVSTDTALPGYDAELDLTAGDAQACADACAADDACCAFTFAADCRLKAFAAAPAASTGAVSGVKPSCAGKKAPKSMKDRVAAKGFKMSAMTAKQAAYWRGVRLPGKAGLLTESPLEDRILPMPAEVMDFMRAANELQGFPESPVAAKVAPGYEVDFRAALADLPDPVKKMVAKKFMAVALAADVGSTALSDAVVDGGRQTAAFTVLDVRKTDVKANAWAAAKESSPFKPAAGETLTMAIESPSHDTRANAIQFILLHEFGHVLAMGAGIHPRWDVPASTATRASDYPFFALSWTIGKDGSFERKDSKAFKGLPPFRFYQQDKSELDASKMAEVYSRLEKTDFVTLYGATNPFDDFAEAFASYVHVVLMGKPYRIVVFKDGKPVKTYGSCWNEPRCAAKRKMIEAFLGS